MKYARYVGDTDEEKGLYNGSIYRIVTEGHSTVIYNGDGARINIDINEFKELG